MNVLLVIVTGIVSHILVSVTFFANPNFQEARLGLGLNITALVDLVPTSALYNFAILHV